MIVALGLDEGIVALRVLEGSFTHDTFIEYLRDDVVRFASLHITRLGIDLLLLASHYNTIPWSPQLPSS
jgi:hypothetical protein